MFKKIRIAVLLFILLSVALTAWRTSMGAHNWRANQFVGIYLINADGSPATTDYLASLDQDSFKPIQTYVTTEMQRHGVALDRALTIQLGPEIKVLPPPMPERPSMLQSVFWSLSMRWWAWKNTPATAVKPEVRLYLLYHDPEKTSYGLDSAGLREGRIGIVHLFASKRMQGSNLVVATHELLHTFGARDKYDPATGLPLNPSGLAEPERSPLYPQQWAEIMSGRLPSSETQAQIPVSLDQTLIGPATAAEIGWQVH